MMVRTRANVFNFFQSTQILNIYKAWSIFYHSWFGFVLLIWANLIWILPNHRKTMLRSSPFLVVFAEFLLLSTYLYSMNLRDDELTASFSEIGFVKHANYAIGPITLKTAFTCMFWVSLRQMLQESALNEKPSALADIHVSSSLNNETTEAKKVIQKKPEIADDFVSKAALTIKTFLMKFWIFIVALTLLLCGVTGEEVTGIRIVYMTMFLIFMLTFQVSGIVK